jgi:hypothetical protein
MAATTATHCQNEHNRYDHDNRGKNNGRGFHPIKAGDF